MRKAVSTADKRALLKAAGEEWPLYPDGTRQSWRGRAGFHAGGRWLSFEEAKAERLRIRRYRRENPEKARASVRKCREEKKRKASALRQRLAKLIDLTNHPSATPAERESARRHAAKLTERMIHGS